MDILLQAGADVNQRPAKYRGATALQLTAIGGYIRVARKLLNRGASTSEQSNLQKIEHNTLQQSSFVTMGVGLRVMLDNISTRFSMLRSALKQINIKK